MDTQPCEETVNFKYFTFCLEKKLQNFPNIRFRLRRSASALSPPYRLPQSPFAMTSDNPQSLSDPSIQISHLIPSKSRHLVSSSPDLRLLESSSERIHRASSKPEKRTALILLANASSHFLNGSQVNDKLRLKDNAQPISRARCSNELKLESSNFKISSNKLALAPKRTMKMTWLQLPTSRIEYEQRLITPVESNMASISLRTQMTK